MSLKQQSLGSAGSAVAGILITSTTNATPIVATITAGHGLKNGDRIAIAGITGNTNANGIWTLGSVTATTAVLLGSVGNAAHGGTAVVGVCMDKTPFMKGHSAVLSFGDSALVGTVRIDTYNNFTDFAAGNAATGGVAAGAPVNDPSFTQVVGTASVPPSSTKAFTAGTVYPVEIVLAPIMKMTAAAWTSGVVRGVITA